MIARYFQFTDRKTDLRTEILAGVTTFMTMAYIIFVNPQILSFNGNPGLQGVGLPFAATMTVTCLVAGLLCIAMGLLTNFPMTMAAGMGLNAVVAYQLVLGNKLSFPAAMGLIVMEGLIITILVLTGFRKAVMDAIPMELKRAIGAGIGLFIALIGFQEAGFIQKNDATMLTLGNLTGWPCLVTVVGFLLTICLMAKKVRGGLFFGIIGTTFLAVMVNISTGYKAFPTPGVAVIPKEICNLPDFSLIGKFDFSAFHVLGLLPAVMLMFSIMLSDFFDTMGTVIGVAHKADLQDKKGNIPNMNRILLIDSLGAMFGGMCSSSSNTCYIEAASGVVSGGRTGLMPVVTGILFLLAIFFHPLAGIVPKEATAPVLIIVGFMMLSVVMEIDWTDFKSGFPAFLTLLGMPFTYSISDGIGFGFISYTLIHLLTGDYRKIHWLMYIMSLGFLLVFLTPVIQSFMK